MTARIAASDWFAVRQIAPGVWRISEPGHVNCYLVEGADRSALIDTGLGMFSIAEVVRAVTERPIEVINTHAHFDHIGNDREFDSVSVHSAGVERLGSDTPRSILDPYPANVAALLDAFDKVRETDEDFFGFFTPDDRPRELLEGFDVSKWKIPPVRATSVLADGDRLDLGGRVLEVMHTPGHTPDSVCFYSSGDSILFTGDTVCSATIYAHAPESSVEDFAASTARLAEMAADVRLLCMAHHMRSIAEGAFLNEVASLFSGVLDRSIVPERTQDEFGEPALLAAHGRARAFLPDPEHPLGAVVAGWAS